MVQFRRGFKSQALEISKEVRTELSLHLASPLDPWRLADHLEVPVVPLRDFEQDSPLSVNYFGKRDTESFSAVTVFRGFRRLIVYNDAHILGRQVSNLAHELAHVLLFHTPTPAIDDTGCRNWDPEMEAEAEWLCGVLLVPDAAAFQIVEQGLSVIEAAARYGVTRRLMTFRITTSAAQRRVERWRAPRPSRA